MDRIIIEDLTLDIHVGVPEAERSKKQRLLMTLEIEHPLQPAALEDSIALTIDYSRVMEAVVALAGRREWRLIETLAEETATMLIEDFGASGAKITVKKFILPPTRWVAVQIERKRQVRRK